MRVKGWLVSLFLLGAVSLQVHADKIAEIFPFQNYSSTFTADVDTLHLNRFSVQVNFSTPAVNDAQIGNNDISEVDNTIYEPSYGFGVGQPVLLSTAGTTSPAAPLVTGTTYYVIRVTDNLLKLATTYAQVGTNDPIDIQTVSAGAWTLRPLPYSAGTVGMLFYASNDGTNWSILSSTHSLVTIGTGTRLFDFGEFAYRYLRFYFGGPNAGVVNLRSYLFGKEE